MEKEKPSSHKAFCDCNLDALYTDLMSTFGRVRSSHESTNAPEPSTQHPDSSSEDAKRNAWKEDIEALYKEAESAHHIGDFEAAAHLYDAILSRDPYHTRSLAGFAMLMRMRGHLEEAEALYLQAIKIDSAFPDALCGYGLLLRTIDRHEEAEDMYKRALELDPCHVNTLCSYGAFMHTLKNNPDEAEAMYLKALKIDPHHVDSICNYAALKHVVRRDMETAEVLYRMGLEENPDHVGILYNYSSLLEEMGNDDGRAEEMYERAMELIQLLSPGIVESESDYCTESSVNDEEWDGECDDYGTDEYDDEAQEDGVSQNEMAEEKTTPQLESHKQSNPSGHVVDHSREYAVA
ncbi:hypothetical protein GUITHDRAFT_115701 [Guillardia theta CCMP2712]|uniref:Uncharacterized protein n=1 Tax=Guillardia theta (strain CCMP2712) TaxID=905079 RepID=L1IPD5_GUITC|nr:hypothetical protein GUITHDRAFT_115701 [Guillardia theta CCMP2712]EKX38151.1 hypothetical protein GUITHDRAFT_115701 [Guillardia theta CCMP2712]|eukprot:XP_005825131.1 hypothetical protein GUITHDRAFT_115701 [Guillardia theta CCMP2712]